MDKVLALIKEIVEKSAGGNYLYRGEPEKYEKVSSSLCREFEKNKINPSDLLEIAEKETVADAKRFAKEKDDFDILAQLQHHGGATNCIDFTTDYLIALFFACDGEADGDGRIILLKGNEASKYNVKRPRTPANRVIAQKSVFVRPPKGYIDEDDFKTIVIPAGMKDDILKYLQHYHAIGTHTIYSDLHGSIRNRTIYKNAYAKFYQGLSRHNQAYKETDEAKKNMLCAEAIQHYTEAIDLNPQNATIHNNRGDVRQALEDYHGAIADYDEAIAINPQFAEAYYNRGVAKWWLGDHQGAISDYDEAIAINPQYAEAYHNRGIAKRQRDNYQDAIADYDRAIAINPKLAEPYYNRGIAKNELSDHHGAIADYDKTININPQDAEVYVNRGIAKWWLGDYQGSIADYDKAIAINPKLAEPYCNRGMAKNKLGDYRGAIADYDKAIAINPQYAKAYNNRGIAKQKIGDRTGAQADMDKAKKLGANIES